MANGRKIRVVVAKPGLDGHDRGAKIIARALRDAGMEVIYTGLHQTPEQIVETVLQEDADAVGLSILSGAHMTLVPRILELLKDQGAGDVIVVLGGTIPNEDVPELKQLGVAEIFTPGASVQGIVDYIKEAARGRPYAGSAPRSASSSCSTVSRRCAIRSSPNSSTQRRSMSAKAWRPAASAWWPRGVRTMVLARRSSGSGTRLT